MAKAKQQTTTEMMVELAKMFVSTDNAEPAELQAADKKVGKTKERRLEWAVNFAQQSPDIMPKADVYNSNLELALFLYPPLALTKEPVRYNASSFIDPTRIPELKERFPKHIKAAALAAALLPLASVAATPASAQSTFCASGGVCGFVFNDANNNGIQDAGETGIHHEGWQHRLEPRAAQPQYRQAGGSHRSRSPCRLVRGDEQLSVGGVPNWRGEVGADAVTL